MTKSLMWEQIGGGAGSTEASLLHIHRKMKNFVLRASSRLMTEPRECDVNFAFTIGKSHVMFDHGCDLVWHVVSFW